MTSLTVFTQDLAQELVDSDNQYPIDFEDAWQWLGYSTKGKAKNKLVRNFDQGVDFLTTWSKTPSGGRPSESFALTIDCFKHLCSTSSRARV
jgi:hypothetical protein